MTIAFQLLPVAAFIETVENTNYWLLRDPDAIDLLNDKSLNLAFIGTDKLGELAIDQIEVVETVYEQCDIPQFVLAGLTDRMGDIPTKLVAKRPLSVATSYPKALARFAQQRGLALNVTDTPKGSVEAYAKSKRVDLVFDIKQSGKTLTDNNLVPFRIGEKVGVSVVKSLNLLKPIDFETSIGNCDKTVQNRLRYPSGSYTSQLLQNRNNARKKVGEEAIEFVIATVKGSRTDMVNEAADVLQALRVNLVLGNLTLKDALLEDIKRGSQAK